MWQLLALRYRKQDNPYARARHASDVVDFLLQRDILPMMEVIRSLLGVECADFESAQIRNTRNTATRMLIQ